MVRWLIFALITLGNAWVWKIGSLNFPIFAILIFTTIILWLLVCKKFTKKLFIIFLVLFGLLIFSQWKMTTPQSLTLLDNDEQRVQQERLMFYKPSLHYTRVIFARLNLGEFLEGDFNTISTRLQRNFFESIDPNVYFFGGHPRERVWAADFEKFPFILIIPFFIGFYQMVLGKNISIFAYVVVSLILLSLIGHKNTLGPFILFPVLVIFIYSGLLGIFRQ